MRLGAFAVVFSVVIAGGACGSSSAEGIFGSGGAGGEGATIGGSAGTGEGGVFGSGGFGGSLGTSGTAGNFGTGGSGAGGMTFDADVDVGVGGTTDSGPEPDGGGSGGSGGTGGTGGTGGGGGNGTLCAGNQCDPGRRCCFPSNNDPYCTAPGAECECTGIGCSSTIMTCDEQSDCMNGEICCAIVAYAPGSVRVSHVRCQPSCSTALVEYIICDPNGPDICPGQTSCSQGLLLSAIDVCQ
jgi:hypothetical protein